MYEGFLSFGGGEVLNSARALGYTATSGCGTSWLQCPPCDGIRDVLGDDAYTYENIFDAPWYDAEDETTHRFLGAHALSIEGLPDSTRDAGASESILDGGVVGRVRRSTRRMQVRAVLTAIGEDALETGFNWLSSALSPGRCGTHADKCGAADMQIFTACPPERADITMPETIWNDPVTNKMTNPAFRTKGAATAMYTNLVTNPSFETAQGTVEVRRNLAVNPGLEANLNQNFGLGTSVTIARSTTEFHSGVASVQVVTPGLALSEGWAQDTPVQPTMPGKPYSAGAWVKAPAGATLYMVTRTSPTAEDSAQTQFVGTGAWQYISTAVKVAQAGATKAEVQVRTRGTAQALTFYVDDIIIEQGIVGSSFNGATPAAGDFSYAWTGTVNASESVQYAPQAATAGVNTPERGVNWQSSAWSRSGSKSIQVSPRYLGMPNGSYAEVYVNGLVAGTTYTLLGYVRLPAALSGTRHGDSLGFWVTGSPNPVVTYITRATNAPGVWEVRGTFVANATSHAVRLMNGAAEGNGDVWWDDFLVVAGTYTGPYFDGSTPAKVRRNLALDPACASGTLISQAGSAPAHTRTVDTAFSHSGGQSVRFDITETDAAKGIGAMMRVPDSLPGGSSIAWSFWVYSTRAGSLSNYGEGTVNGAYSGMGSTPAGTTIPANQWTKVVGTGVLPLGGQITNWKVGGYNLKVQAGDTLWVDEFQIELGTSVGTYFDGATPIAPYAAAWDGAVNASASYLYDDDFTYAWTGVAHASTSERRAFAVPGNLFGEPKLAFYISDNGAKAIVKDPTGGGGRSLYIDLETGRQYTITVRGRITSPTNPGLRWASAWDSGPLNWTNEFVDYTYTFTAANTRIFLENTSALVDAGVEIQHIMLVEGQYGGAYFDGSSEDSPPEDHTIPGTVVHEYEWTGTADASTSTYRTGSVVAVPDPVAYELAIEKLIRNLHTVTCVAGPTVEQKLHRGETWGYVVEFILVAAVPWMFGLTKPVDLQPSLPIVVQDVPFNLMPYPSAELALGSVVAATNYSPNPSSELDAATFSANSQVITPTATGARTTELYASGIASYKVSTVATNSGTSGSMWALQTIQLPAYVAGQRFSFNAWLSAILSSGTAVIGGTRFRIEWKDASNAIVGNVTIGTGTPAGGALSSKSLLRPATATQVTLVMIADLTSWSVGAAIALYIDSIAVTVP